MALETVIAAPLGVPEGQG